MFIDEAIIEVVGGNGGNGGSNNLSSFKATPGRTCRPWRTRSENYRRAWKESRGIWTT